MIELPENNIEKWIKIIRPKHVNIGHITQRTLQLTMFPGEAQKVWLHW